MRDTIYKNITSCRICGNKNLPVVLDLGKQYLASVFVAKNNLKIPKIPLSLVLCDKSRDQKACGLLQLGQTVNKDLMYRHYFYRSQTNPLMRFALKNIVDDVSKRAFLVKGDFVLDIGCNDGTMLNFYPSKFNRVGMDPAKNIKYLNKRKIKFVNDYFSGKKALKASGGKKFKAITSIAMFYDIDKPNDFVEEVKSILAPKGIWCIQLSYLPTTLNTLNFYDICHEHVAYYSLGVLKNLMERNGLSIFDASLSDVNGGSLRIFVSRKNDERVPSARFKNIYNKEKKMKLESEAPYRDFSEKIQKLKDSTVNFVKSEVSGGGKVLGLGASTKGNVLLQHFGLTKDLIPYISERNPEKVGLRTLGTDIKLVSEDAARNMNPSAMLVLIWFFKDEILKREAQYLKNGGKLFFPMPYPHIINCKEEIKLA